MSVVLLLTVLMTGLILTMLFYHAMTEPQPTRVIVVRGNAEWEGIDLIVTGGNLDEPRATKFEKLGKYVVPFYLWPGKYTLHVQNQGVEVFKRDVNLYETETEDIDLIRAGATTRPATRPVDAATTDPA